MDKNKNSNGILNDWKEHYIQDYWGNEYHFKINYSQTSKEINFVGIEVAKDGSTISKYSETYELEACQINGKYYELFMREFVTEIIDKLNQRYLKKSESKWKTGTLKGIKKGRNKFTLNTKYDIVLIVDKRIITIEEFANWTDQNEMDLIATLSDYPYFHNGWNLSHVFGNPRLYAIELIEKGKVSAGLGLVNRSGRMAFVLNNVKILKKYKLFEEALFDAYIASAPENNYFPINKVRELFSLSDRDRLRSQGDSLPQPDSNNTYTLYRGISWQDSKASNHSLINGISWTSSYKIAKWFAAEQFAYKTKCNPKVYKAQVPKDNIFAYTNRNNEEEFLCDITEDIKIVEIWNENIKCDVPIEAPYPEDSSGVPIYYKNYLS